MRGKRRWREAFNLVKKKLRMDEKLTVLGSYV